MKTTNALRRLLSIGTGGAILAASASAVIAITGQSGSHATLTWSLAGGLFVGAIIVAAAWGERRKALAVALAAALVLGELGNIGLSIESIIIRREADGKATRQAAGAHKHAAGELVKAEEALAAANRASVAKSAERDCRENCRKLLEAQIEIAKADLARARQLFTSNPAPSVSETALADRIGLPAWAVDVVLAVLLAIGANAVAALLVAYGAHGSPSAHSLPNPDTIPPDELDEARRILVPPKNGSPNRSPNGSDPISAYILTEIALGRAIPSQQGVAERFGVSRSTAHERFVALEAAGLIVRRREGRRMVAVSA